VKYRQNTVSEIAEERIRALYSRARKIFGKDQILTKRYVELAKRIGMRTRVRVPKELKYFTCRTCNNLLVPGVNCRVRVRPDRGAEVVMTCLVCGDIKRYPTTRERSKHMKLRRVS